jgi:hypothetical protein
MLPFQYKQYSLYIYAENGTNGKRQLPFVCCKRKTETTNFRLFSANGNRKFVFPWAASFPIYDYNPL